MKGVRNYFNSSGREYRASVFIVILLILLLTARLIMPYVANRDTNDFTAFKKEIEAFEASAYSDSTVYMNNYVTDFSKDYKYNKTSLTEDAILFDFDPNTTDSADFVQLGLSPKQARVICNYRRKGGKFYNKEGFHKMYCISEKMFSKLEPFISIAEQKKEPAFTEKKFVRDTTFASPKTFTPKKDNDIIVELNDADTTALKRIRGIGSTFAKRLVAYREKLGGYLNKRQLLEVYGVDTAVYKILDKHIVIDSTIVKKININTVGFYTLKNCPYLKQSQVSALLNYRDKHGKFAKPADIKNCVLINDETYNKIKPYIKTSD